MKTRISVFLALLLPAVSAVGSHAAGKKLEEALSPWEKAVATALPKAERDRYEAAKAKDADETVIKEWQAKIKASASGYAGGADADRLDEFESRFFKAYVESRFPDADPAKQYNAMGFEASLDEARKSGARPNPAETAVASLRRMLKSEFAAYAKTGKPPEKGLLETWVSGSFQRKPGEEAFPLASANAAAAELIAKAPPLEEPKKDPAPAEPKKDALQEAIAALFADKVEQRVIEAVARKQGAEAWTKDLIKIKQDNDQARVAELKSRVLSSIADYVSTNGNPADPALGELGKTLSQNGVQMKELLAYYCPKTSSPGAVLPGASKPAASPKAQAEKLKANSIWAAGSGKDEEAKSRADVTPGAQTAMADRCQNFFNERKKEEFADSPPQERPSLAMDQPVPTPDKEPEVPKKKPIPWRKLAIGGATGAIGFGILGFIFGGPIGFLIGAAAGMALMGVVTAVNNEVI